jgi:hypothetical protein
VSAKARVAAVREVLGFMGRSYLRRAGGAAAFAARGLRR